MAFCRLSDQTPLYYEEAGPIDAPALLLVPGWTFSAALWQRQVEPLARKFRVITCDLRGAGRSGKSLNRHSLAEYADDLAQLLGHLGVTNCGVAGWAMGASVAAHLATGPHRDLVSHLVWIDHSPCFFDVPGWDYAIYGNMTAARFSETVSQLHADRPTVVTQLLGDMFPFGLSQDDFDAFYAMSFQTPAEVASRMLMLVAQADLRPILPAIACPVLVVNGAQSIVPAGVGAWMCNQLPNGRALVLDPGGHAPFWDQADRFNAEVEAFLLDR